MTPKQIRHELLSLWHNLLAGTISSSDAMVRLAVLRLMLDTLKAFQHDE